MKEIIDIVNKIKSGELNAQGKAPVANFGFLACSSLLRINNVPFYEPCLIFVLSGVKTIHKSNKAIKCHEGDCLAVSAPSSFSLTNEPDMKTGKYQALVIPFSLDLLKEIRKNYSPELRQITNYSETVLHYSSNDSLINSLKHYLTTEKEMESLLLEHRITEILLQLVKENEEILGFINTSDNWEQRVRTILSEDITFSWSIQHVCDRLAVSESTLRRMLQKENQSFRDILKELRLSSSLMVLLQTTRPIYQVASDCGYESASRFSENFRSRFGLPPTKFRKTNIETG